MSNNLTDIDTRRLALAWQCFDIEPKVDYEKLALLTGSKNAHAAREGLRVTKKKLFALGAGDATAAAAAKKKQNGKTNALLNRAAAKANVPGAKKRGRKVAVKDEQDTEDDGGDSRAMKKVARGRSGLEVEGAVVKEEVGGEEEDGGADYDDEKEDGDAEGD